MTRKLTAASLAVAVLSSIAFAEDKLVVPKGPPPRFITVRAVDQVKEKIVFDVQVVVQRVDDEPTMLVYPDGHQRLTLGTKPSHIHLGEGFQVSSKKAKWRGVDGRAMAQEAALKRLKPGTIILLSADGSEVETPYLNMFKEDTLVLVVPADELPVPYDPHSGGGISVKKIDTH